MLVVEGRALRSVPDMTVSLEERRRSVVTDAVRELPVLLVVVPLLAVVLWLVGRMLGADDYSWAYCFGFASFLGTVQLVGETRKKRRARRQALADAGEPIRVTGRLDDAYLPLIGALVALMGVGSAIEGTEPGATVFLLGLGAGCIALGYPGLRDARRRRRAEERALRTRHR